jgi:hypothetical protein
MERNPVTTTCSAFWTAAGSRPEIPSELRRTRRPTSTLKKSRASARCRCTAACPGWPRRGPIRKDIVIHRKANPILYAYKEHAVLSALKELMKAAKDDAANPIWTITPFVDALGDYGKSKYFFEWEREWRKVGDCTFATDEVEFLIIPESLHETARGFFKNVKAENLGCKRPPLVLVRQHFGGPLRAGMAHRAPHGRQEDGGAAHTGRLFRFAHRSPPAGVSADRPFNTVRPRKSRLWPPVGRESRP